MSSITVNAVCQKKVLELWSEGKSALKISAIMNISVSSVRRILKSNDIKLKDMNFHLKFTDNERQEIINLYLCGFSTIDIANIYSPKVKCDRTIATYLRRWGVPIRPSGYQTFIQNEDFFSTINTEEKAYFLGLLYADGCVTKSKKKYKVLEICLQAKDGYLIDKLISLLGVYQIKKDFTNPKQLPVWELKNAIYCSDKDQFSTIIHSKKIYDDLNRNGMYEQKTWKIDFPENVPKNLLKHFIRGFFDGDGTVFRNARGSCIFGFYSQHNFLESLQNFLVNEISLSKLKIYDKETISFMTWSRKEDLKSFYQYIYSDCSIWMNRKKEKFDSFDLFR